MRLWGWFSRSQIGSAGHQEGLAGKSWVRADAALNRRFFSSSGKLFSFALKTVQLTGQSPCSRL